MMRTILHEQDPKDYWLRPADKYSVMTVDTENRKKVEKVMQESSYGGFPELNGRS